MSVWNSKAVRGALVSLLGEDYIIHPHRYAHLSSPSFPGQPWHQDDYASFAKTHNHLPRWIIGFYYPQTVYLSMPIQKGYDAGGAQGALPTTWNTHQHHVICNTGAVALFHYNLWHKGNKNTGRIDRFGIKFIFVRMKSPKITWNFKSDLFPHIDDPLLPVYKHIWRWMCGGQPSETDQLEEKEIDALTKVLHKRPLHANFEIDRVAAVYKLACGGFHGGAMLLEALIAGDEPVRRSAAYGFTALPATIAVPLLSRVLQEHHPIQSKKYAAFALGELASLQATDVLLHTLHYDGAPVVRRDAAEALGTIYQGCPNKTAVKLVVEELSRTLKVDQDVVVRQSACLSLAQIASDESTMALKGALLGERYVRGYALIGLKRIGAEVDTNSHWCPFTSDNNQY